MDSLLRDIRSATRATSDAGRQRPLKPAADAVILDTTDLTIDAAIDAVLGMYRASGGDATRQANEAAEDVRASGCSARSRARKGRRDAL